MGANFQRVLLINPPSGSYIRDDRCQVPVNNLSSSLRMPLDLAYMAAVLEKEAKECLVRDYPAEGVGWQGFQRQLRAFRPDILVVSVTTPTLALDMLACRAAKELDRGILTVAKGAHFISEDIDVLRQFPNLDIAMRGECELTIGEIAAGRPLSDIPGITYRSGCGIIRNDPRPFLENLDLLPFPARHLLNNRLYCRPDTRQAMTSIQTNRGCPADCIFCLVKQVSGRRIASRSPVSIAEEMVFCRERFGIDNFYFRADTFTWDKQWVIEVCRRIIDTKLKFHWVANSRVDTVDEERLHWMKKSGCWMVGFGAESGDQTILEWIKKGITREEIEKAVALCNRAGIKSYLFWVLGFPWDSDATVRNTISFARGLKSDFAEFHLAFPFPGTEFYRIGLENNLFSKSDLAKGNVKQGIARTIFLPREKLRDYHRMAIRKYYLDARRIGRLLRGIGSPKVFLNYCRKAWDVLGGA